MLGLRSAFGGPSIADCAWRLRQACAISSLGYTKPHSVMAENLYSHQDSNVRKTWLLMTGFFLLVITLGWLFAQAYQAPEILYFAVGLSLVMNLTAYWKSDTIA